LKLELRVVFRNQIPSQECHKACYICYAADTQYCMAYKRRKSVGKHKNQTKGILPIRLSSFKTLRVLQSFSGRRLKVHLLVPNSFGVENNTINHLRHGEIIQSVLTYCCAMDLGTFSSICWHCVIATVIQSPFVVKRKKHRHCVGPYTGSAVVFCA